MRRGREMALYARGIGQQPRAEGKKRDLHEETKQIFPFKLIVVPG